MRQLRRNRGLMTANGARMTLNITERKYTRSPKHEGGGGEERKTKRVQRRSYSSKYHWVVLTLDHFLP